MATAHATSSLVTEVLGAAEDPQFRDLEVDPIILTADERARGHLRVTSESGRVLKVSLDRGAELSDGDVLTVEGNTKIVVQAQPEDILVLSPPTARQWGVASFVLGNLHRPVRFTDESIHTPYEHSTAQALEEAEIPYERAQAPLVGQRIKAVGGHSHD